MVLRAKFSFDAFIVVIRTKRANNVGQDRDRENENSIEVYENFY